MTVTHASRRAHAVVIHDICRRERLVTEDRPRVPEVMALDDGDAVEAFDAGGAQGGPMPAIYEASARSVSRLLPHGGSVLDLGCGSARCIAHLAARRPDVSVVGVDLSDEMLARGRALLRRRGLSDRVELRLADMRDVDALTPVQPDVITAVLSLHHLPTRDDLVRCLRAIARLASRTGAAVWLFDFARLRDPKSYTDLLAGSTSMRGTLREGGIASEAAAWTFAELEGSLHDAGLQARGRLLAPLALFQSHCRRGAAATGTAEPSLARIHLSPDVDAEATALDKRLGVTFDRRAG